MVANGDIVLPERCAVIDSCEHEEKMVVNRTWGPKFYQYR